MQLTSISLTTTWRDSSCGIEYKVA